MPDVRWCHPSIRRASRSRGEGKNPGGLRSCAVAPVAAVRQTRGGARRTAVLPLMRLWAHRHLAHFVALEHSWPVRSFTKETARRPLLGRHRLPSHRFLLRSSTAAGVGHHLGCGGIAKSSVMGTEENQDRAHSSAQPSKNAPGVTIATTHPPYGRFAHQRHRRAAPPNLGMQRTRFARR